MNIHTLRLKTQIYSIVVILMVLMIIMVSVIFVQLKSIGGELKGIVEEDLPLVETVTKLREHQLEQAIWFERALRAWDQTQTDDDAILRFKKAEDEFKQLAQLADAEVIKAEHISEQAMSKATNTLSRKEFRTVNDHLKSIEKEHVDYERHVFELFDLLKQRQLTLQQQIKLRIERIEKEEDQLNDELKTFLVSVEKFTEASLLQAEQHEENAIQVVLWLLLFALIVGSVLSLNIIRIILKKIGGEPDEIMQIAQDVASGNIHNHLQDNVFNTKNTGVLASIIEMAKQIHQRNKELMQSEAQNRETVEQVTKICKTIANGDYSREITPKNDQDILNISLFEMNKNLREVSAENQQQDWLKSGQNLLNESMRGDLNEVILARNIITTLAKYLNAQIGAFYLVEDDKDVLKLCGSYAFNKRKDLNDRIKIGEGIVGQAAFENEIISLTNIPESYTRIHSAIGDEIPHNVLVVPFSYEGRLIGVIELGAFQEFSDLDMEFISNITENIAIGVSVVKANSRTQDLLSETQRQSEELQAQQEELRVTNEELQTQQEELRVSNEELQEKSDSLETQSEELRLANEDLSTQKYEIEQKNTEVELKAEELAVSSKYKSEFLANMSHELRTPLNSMLLLSSNLAKNKEGNLSAKQVESASIVHKGGEDLLNLINEILDLSKIEAGMMELELSSIPFQELKKSLERNFKHMTEVKGLDLIINMDAELPTCITSDRTRLEQILKNLISNAIKFTHEGSITINFARAALDIDLSKSGIEPANSIAIAVIDTGIGIPEDKQKVIFEAFQQAEGGTTRQYGGTGLGLSISRELTALLGGEVQLQSQAGQGSSFTLYLSLGEDEIKNKQRYNNEESEGNEAVVLASLTVAPVKQSKNRLSTIYQVEDDKLDIGGAGSRTDDKKIMLVIEDDTKFAKILLNQCHDQGFMCLATTTGEEGLTLASQYLPDGIILDLNLPGIDGWHVLNALKENAKTRHIPVHIMSVDDEQKKAKTLGAIGFVSKPVKQEQLDESFQRIIANTNKVVKDLLVIEDDVSTLSAIEAVIGNGDVKITQVSKGREGIKTLLSGNFDCVILDLNLPDISGFEVLDRLVQEQDFTLPPIIIYTGKDLSKKEHHQLLKYSNAIIIKGVDSEERLLDETSLFLHRIVEKLPNQKQKIIHDLHSLEAVFKDKKVMVVDDDMRNVFAMTQTLEEKGIQVFKAEDGLSALTMLKQNIEVDLILMDIMMPGMDGYETTQQVREQEQYKDLPIIALTAKAMKEDRDKCIAAGANDYLSKPVDEQRLFSMMRIWLYK